MENNKISSFFERLPFAPLYKKVSEKIPTLAKFDAYANQIISGMLALVLVLIVAAVGGGKSVKPVQKELAKINDPASRYWSNFIGENGINAIDSSGKTILMAAIESANFPLVKACLKCGADPNLVVQSGYERYSPADFLESKCNDVDILKIMLEKGAKIESNELSVFMVATVHFNNPQYVELYLKHIPSEKKDFSKYSAPGHSCVFSDRIRPSGDMLNVLVKSGVKPSKQDFRNLVSRYSSAKEKDAAAYEKAIEHWAKDLKIKEDEMWRQDILLSVDSWQDSEKAEFIRKVLS